MTAPEGKALLRTQLQLQCAFANGRQDSLLPSGLGVRPPCRWKLAKILGSGDRVPRFHELYNTLKKTGKARRFSGRTTMLCVGGWLPKIDLTAIK